VTSGRKQTLANFRGRPEADGRAPAEKLMKLRMVGVAAVCSNALAGEENE